MPRALPHFVGAAIEPGTSSPWTFLTPYRLSIDFISCWYLAVRLLNVDSLKSKEFSGDDIPPYIIASHRWGDVEPTYRTFKEHRGHNTEGFHKVAGFGNAVRRNIRGIEWLWIDTCCIDKENSVELSEAINSMFKWYQNAKVCYAYLQDLDDTTTGKEFGQSAWFGRGWTLQELLASSVIIFYDRKWVVQGYKSRIVNERYRGELKHLNMTISRTSGIPIGVLCDVNESKKLSIQERIGWIANRQTTRPEDMVYSLLGIFEVYMPPIYGEGYRHAYRRLMREIGVRQNEGQYLYLNTLLDGSHVTQHTERTPERKSYPRRTSDCVVLQGTSWAIPSSAFQWQDKSSGKLYTVVSCNGYLVQVFEDGRTGIEIAETDPGTWSKSCWILMEELWSSAGRPMGPMSDYLSDYHSP